jgi:uncharacterized protein YkwD
MRLSTRSVSSALMRIVILAAASQAIGQDAPTRRSRPTTQVADRRLRELPTRPSPARPAALVIEELRSDSATSVPSPGENTAVVDPYGFAAILNAYRASAGLHPLAYDADLSNWAAHNNAAQARRGLGHHVLPNCYQNCGWNYSDAWSLARGWMNSPGHRENMLTPSATRFGIAYGPGPYWTLNAQ